MSGTVRPDARRRVLVTGAHGFIGRHIVHRLGATGDTAVMPFVRRPGGDGDLVADLSDIPGAVRAIERARPTHIVHTAAMASIAACAADPRSAEAINTDATAAIAAAAERLGARLIHFSTDQVFDGDEAPYRETSAPRPLHVYGETKARAEEAILRGSANAVILRVALVFGRSGSGERTPNEQILAAVRAGRTIDLFTDEFRTPVAVRWIAAAVTELLDRPFTGILNAAGPDRVSRAAFGRLVLRAHGIAEDEVIRETLRRSMAGGPPRPRDLSLDQTLARQVVGEKHASLSDELSRLLPSPE